MPDLDLATLIVVTLVVNLLVALYMALLARLQPQQSAFRHWAAACFIFVLASLLATGRVYQVPAVFSVLLAHALLALPPLLVATGLLRFIEGPLAKLPWPPITGWMLVYLLALGSSYSYHHSAAVLNAAAIVASCVWGVKLLQQIEHPRFINRLLQTVLALHALTMLMEIYLYLRYWNTALPVAVADILQWILSSHLLLTTVAAVLLPLIFFITREQTLLRQANQDELTQLPNRRYFLQESIAYLTRKGDNTAATVMMLDLDHFKAINDNYGHNTGDVALRQVAQILTQELRKTDFLGRLGGEEFAIVLPDTTETEARNISQRLRQQVEQQARVVDGKALGLTISIGAVYSSHFSAGQFERLLKQADDALYDAKRSGRNTVTFYCLG
jgi:diguanylate cyclase (GGDEF)-like protein